MRLHSDSRTTAASLLSTRLPVPDALHWHPQGWASVLSGQRVPFSITLQPDPSQPVGACTGRRLRCTSAPPRYHTGAGYTTASPVHMLQRISVESGLPRRRVLLLTRAANPFIKGFVRKQGALHGAVAEVRKSACRQASQCCGPSSAAQTAAWQEDCIQYRRWPLDL